MIASRWPADEIEPAARAVVVGAFDGLHIGHQYLIRRTCAEAASAGVEATVLTFEPTPDEFFAPPDTPGMRLTVADERLDLLRALCVDHVVIADFNDQLRALTAEAFARDVLVGQLNAKVLIAAENHSFGRGAEAGIDAIARLGQQYGFALVVLPLLKLDGEPVSSTQVRRYLREAHAEEAAALLARHYSVRGKVVPGAAVGRELGFPTANLQVPANKLIPASAVYAALADGPALRSQLGADSVPCPAAVNVGPQPTFGRSQSAVEAHMITDRPLDLMGSQVDLSFVRRLRFVERFPDTAALTARIARDIEEVRTLLSGHASGSPGGNRQNRPE